MITIQPDDIHKNHVPHRVARWAACSSTYGWNLCHFGQPLAQCVDSARQCFLVLAADFSRLPTRWYHVISFQQVECHGGWKKRIFSRANLWQSEVITSDVQSIVGCLSFLPANLLANCTAKFVPETQVSLDAVGACLVISFRHWADFLFQTRTFFQFDDVLVAICACPKEQLHTTSRSTLVACVDEHFRSHSSWDLLFLDTPTHPFQGHCSTVHRLRWTVLTAPTRCSSEGSAAVVELCFKKWTASTASCQGDERTLGILAAKQCNL